MRGRRIPILLQLNAVECGAACLAMVLNYHGRETSIAECRQSCNLGQDAATAKNIAQAARSFGLRVTALSIEPHDFGLIHLPAIVHWEFQHFVVVESWSPDRVGIIDPAVGRCHLTASEFDAGFTGVVLAFDPGTEFTSPPPKNQPAWRVYLRTMFSAPGALGMVLQVSAASLCLLILGLALPIVTKVIIDHVLPFHINSVLTILGIGLGILVLAHAVASYLRSALLVYLQAQIDARMMVGFFEHLLSLPFRFFQQRSSGDLLMRLSSNTMIREILTNQMISTALDGTLVVGYLLVIVIRAPSFGLLLLLIGFCQIALLLGTQRRMRDLTQRDLLARANSQSYLVEALAGVSMLKASGMESLVLGRWSDLFFTELNASLRRNLLAAVVDTARQALHTLLPLALLWVGALEVLHGAMSLGTMLALTALAAAFLAPSSSLLSNLQRMQLVGAQLDRLTDVLNADPEQDPRQVQGAPRLSGRIEVRNLSFRYSPAAPLALQDVSLVIERGQKVAMVGRSGSGKSTLVRLLLGFYQPDQGEILYDGMNLQTLNYRTVRGQLGVVMQEQSLFSGTIRENIGFTEPGAAFDTVLEAARLAAIHDEITQMPMAYETRIAEGGTGLSGGQRQRLALASALVRKPSILILDEATSNLDAVNEALIDSNLSSLICTRVVVAHRLSTVRNADQILVFDAGQIVERGTHESLMSLGGHYANLVRTQTGTEAAHSTKA